MCNILKWHERGNPDDARWYEREHEWLVGLVADTGHPLAVACGVASTLSRTSIDSNVVSISEPNVDADANADADAYRQTIGASR